MRVLDLFAGTGSSTQAFEDRGHSVTRVEMDTQHVADVYADVLDVRPEWFTEPFDFIWASPPCTAFSVASIGKHWAKGGDDPQPKSAHAVEAQALVAHTLDLIKALSPECWLLENPRGMLRKLKLMQPYARRTVTYCQYGDERQKPTDLWGVMPGTWTPRPMCEKGQPCHVAAPRGSSTGTQGRVGSVERSRVPYELSLEICLALENALCPRVS